MEKHWSDLSDEPIVLSMPVAIIVPRQAGLILSGYGCALASLCLYPVWLALAVALFAIVLCQRGRWGHALFQMAVLAVCCPFGMMLGAALLRKELIAVLKPLGF